MKGNDSVTTYDNLWQPTGRPQMHILVVTSCSQTFQLFVSSHEGPSDKEHSGLTTHCYWPQHLLLFRWLCEHKGYSTASDALVSTILVFSFHRQRDLKVWSQCAVLFFFTSTKRFLLTALAFAEWKWRRQWLGVFFRNWLALYFF